MREIKFRAWDKINGRMVGDIPNLRRFSPSTGLDSATIQDKIPQYTLIGDKEVALMQYTGLKDKDGREIYEGDVVKDSRDAFNRNSKISWANSRGGFWKEPFEVGNPMHQFGRCLDSETAITLEVIGNIYEHAELLEGGK